MNRRNFIKTTTVAAIAAPMVSLASLSSQTPWVPADWIYLNTGAIIVRADTAKIASRLGSKVMDRPVIMDDDGRNLVAKTRFIHGSFPPSERVSYNELASLIHQTFSPPSPWTQGKLTHLMTVDLHKIYYKFGFRSSEFNSTSTTYVWAITVRGVYSWNR